MTNRLKFNPTISFDGVAIITGVILLAVWMGRLDQRVLNNSESIQNNAILVGEFQKQLNEVREMNMRMGTLIEERTRRP